MPTISLQEITKENWRECIRLEVATDQRNFVATNARSLTQAAYENDWQPRAITDGDTMVGFVMYRNMNFEGKDVWVIARLMVGEQHQRKGYGKAGIRAALKLMKADISPAEDVYISFVPENEAARKLYTDLGFADIGRTPDGSEILMHMKLDTM